MGPRREPVQLKTRVNEVMPKYCVCVKLNDDEERLGVKI